MVSVNRLRNLLSAPKYPSSFQYPTRAINTRKISKPLRILFCGSDDFSVASLRALQAEAKKSPEFIKSIDVLCRPPKQTGRGLKVLQQVPLYHAAKEMKLKIHQKDTFAEWDPPTPDGEPINLIIAVSFGLFIPPRIIRAAEYGGLNVHPSMLPDYRGSAPLQRMIIRGAKRSGITLQTLDTKKFDHGVILAQKQIRIPHPTTITYQELLDVMIPEGAEILMKGIHQRMYVPPLLEVGRDSYQNSLPADQLVLAPKITKEDRHINWHRDDAATRIDRRHRALGPLYSILYVDENLVKRFVFHDIGIVERPAAVKDMVWKWKTGRWFTNNEELNLVYSGENNSDEESFNAWQASGQQQPGQTEDEAYASWVEFRKEQLALENKTAPKQNVYHMIDETVMGDKAPVFYVEDGTAIIVAVKGAGLRIQEITVEGDKRKPAAAAMKMYRKKGMWKLQLKMIEGTDRWFAEFNTKFVDTFDKQKWIETLPPDQREEQEDKKLWAQIEEEKKRERELLSPNELIMENERLERMRQAKDRRFEKEQAQRARLEARAQRRLEFTESKRKKQELRQIKEDLKKGDWPDLLRDEHRELFPEAFAKARLERLNKKEEPLNMEQHKP